MHIALVNRWYPPHSGYGGVATYNQTLARALCRRGHRVTVLAVRWSSDAPPEEDDHGVFVLRELTTQDRSLVQRIPVLKRYLRPFEEYRRAVRNEHRLLSLHAEEKVDVVEFADIGAEGYRILRSSRAEVASVVRCHTPTFVLMRYYRRDEIGYDTTLTSMMEKTCIRCADALTAPSSDMAKVIERCCQLPKGSVYVIPNPVDVHEFDSAALKVDLTPGAAGRPVALHVGRLERVKGVEILIRAIPRVLDVLPETRFVFAGTPRPHSNGKTWREYLQGLAGDLGVGDAVEFLGEVEPQELKRLYGRAAVVVVPSLNYESFSYTCAQAMAAGVPLVASRIGGIPETVGDDAGGILVEPGNVGELGNAISQVLLNAELQKKLSHQGKKRTAQFFDSEKVADRMSEFYSTVVHR